MNEFNVWFANDAFKKVEFSCEFGFFKINLLKIILCSFKNISKS
jgi:hypothetical protein